MQVVETGRFTRQGRLTLELSAYPDGVDTEPRLTGETYDCGACPDPHPIQTPRPDFLARVWVEADEPGEDEATAAALLEQGRTLLADVAR